jgi:hypothetical protein
VAAAVPQSPGELPDGLAERFPSHVVCDWIGNSEAVAKAHYLQTTDQRFATAAAMPAESKPVGQPDAKSDAAKSGTVTQGAAPSSADIRIAGEILQVTIQCVLRGEGRMGDGGLEPSTSRV